MKKQQVFGHSKRHNVYCGYCRDNNYIAGLSHNFYSDYSGDIHKNHALHHYSSSLWSEQRIKATLNEERRHQLTESIMEFALIASFVAMFAIAYLT